MRDISGEGRPADALLAGLVAAMDDGVVVTDADRRILTWAGAAPRLFGYTEEEALGCTVRDLLQPEYPDSDYDALLRSWRDGVRTRVYMRMRCKDGTRRDMDVSVTPLRDAAGQVTRLLAVGRDIGPQKATERALRASEARFRALTGSAPVGVFEIDPVGSCQFVNAAWERITGISAAEARGQGWVSAVVPDDLDALRARFAAHAQQGEPFDIELRLQLAAGERRTVHLWSGPLRDDDGRVGGYVGIVIDVTEQRRKEAALEASHEQLALVLTAARDGFFDYDLGADVFRWSPRVARMLGVGPDDMPETFGGWCARMHPDDVEVFQRAVRAHQAGKQASIDVEYRVRGGDGAWVWLRGRGRTMDWDAAGNPVRIVGTLSDISERKGSPAGGRPQP